MLCALQVCRALYCAVCTHITQREASKLVNLPPLQIADERSGAVGDLDSIRQNRDALKVGGGAGVRSPEPSLVVLKYTGYLIMYTKLLIC